MASHMRLPKQELRAEFGNDGLGWRVEMMNKNKSFQKFIPRRPAESDPAFGEPRVDVAESRRLAQEVAEIIRQSRLEGGMNRSRYIPRDRMR